MSKPHTPVGSRPGTPSRLVPNVADAYIKNPPNNLGLRDPSSQSRTNDLLGARDTKPVDDEPPSAEELERVKALAAKLAK